MANVSASEVAELEVPLPALPIQQEIVSHLDGLSHERRSALARLRQIDRRADDRLTEALGVRPQAPPRSFAIRTSSLGLRLDPAAHAPVAEGSGEFAALGELALIDPERGAALGGDLVPYVGLPDCTQTRIRSITTRPRASLGNVKVARNGDILFARIEPSIFNRKYVWVEVDRFDSIAVSPEFLVIRPDRDLIHPEFVYAALFSGVVQSQIEGRTTGSSGRRRLDRSALTSVQIPVPPRRTQEAIATEFLSSQSEKRALEGRVADLWDQIRAQMQERLFREAT